MYKFRRDQVLDPEFLTKLVERFKKEYVPRFIRDQQYYEVKTEILKRTMTDGKPNNRLALYHKYGDQLFCRKTAGIHRGGQ